MRRLGLLAAAVLVAGCSGGGSKVAVTPVAADTEVPTTTSTTTTALPPAQTTTTTSPPPSIAALQATATTRASTTSTTVTPWVLGATPLNRRPDGYGEILPTPPALRDRRLQTADVLPPPADGAFHSTVVPMTDEIVDRAGWQAACPVGRDGLRYVTVGFWGFDGHAHTGELVVGTSVADGVVSVFHKLFDAKFPLEDLRLVRPDSEAGKPPTGDGNTSGAFSCRPKRGSTTSWSAHAYGTAIDIDPFQNPYSKGDVVLPERASAYLDRANKRPGMIQPGDVVVKAFASIGWTWGGSWNSPKDRMHFSQNGT